MNKNVGSMDRTIRFILAIVIFAVGIYYQSWWGLLGVIPMFTALINRCPLYLPLGITTCKTKEVEKQ